MKDLSGWGRYPRHFGPLLRAESMDGAARVAAQSDGLVARGLGRSYGDAAMGRDTTLSATGLNRLRAFDPSSGLLEAEAGVSLAEIIAVFLPRGYFPPVVPGTRFVTLGGMIASDVHGKNQHNDGTFGDHVAWLSLALPDGTRLRCSRTENQALFHATIGGMGLTGVILEAAFRLRPIETGWIRQTTHVAQDLSQAIAMLRQTQGAPYTVAWIDVLATGAAQGRSLILEGRHATADELTWRQKGVRFPAARRRRLSVPLDMPGWLLNTHSVSAFNALYFRRGARASSEPTLVPWETYFFPLDGIGHWNRFYGSRGFVQHQCVIPDAHAETILAQILDLLSTRGEGSCLAVLKRLAPASGLMSFPMDGLTLALDLPVSERRLSLVARIDGLVSRVGGRIYLAKDACQSRETLVAGYPDLERFREVRREVGSYGRIASKLSQRLGL